MASELIMPDLTDCSNYVRNTLQPMLHQLIEKPTACSFELDPSKAGPNEDIENNAERLRLVCQALLDVICASTSRVPVYVAVIFVADK